MHSCRLVGRRVALGASLMFAACRGSTAKSEALTVFAAASTQGAVADLVTSWRANQGGEVHTSFAASSTLAQQIARGAPAEIFVSAHLRWMRHLQRRGLIETGSPVALMSTRLAIVIPKGRRSAISAIPDAPFGDAFVGKLALGDPTHVPLGIYAKQALVKLGWWNQIASRVVPALDARAALAFVERGECGAGIVYEADARRSRRVDVVAILPADSHPPVTYYLAMVRGRVTRKARALYRYMQGAEARAALRRHGFTAPSSEAPQQERHGRSQH